MSSSRKKSVKEPQPPEIPETKDPKVMMEILNWCQIIYKTVQRLEKKFDDIDEKVKKIYHSRARSFFHYPPFKAVSRKYNYLRSKRFKLQRLRRFIRDNSISYPQSYSPTSPVRKSNENRQDMESTQAVDYLPTCQSPNSVNSTQTFRCTGRINNTPTSQYADSIANTKSIQNAENNAVPRPVDSQEVILIDSSPERDYQESPPSPVYTAETYKQYYRLRDIPGSSTMPYYNDFENRSLCTISSTVSEASTLPPGELIPIQNPEMRRLALLEAQRTPTIDPNTFGSSSKCNDAVVRYLGNPVNWSVNDVITFLNRLDPPLADELYLTITQHAIDGKALLLLDSDTMIKYMRMKVGVAMKFSSYIQKLKEGAKCGQ